MLQGVHHHRACGHIGVLLRVLPECATLYRTARSFEDLHRKHWECVVAPSCRWEVWTEGRSACARHLTNSKNHQNHSFAATQANKFPDLDHVRLLVLVVMNRTLSLQALALVANTHQGQDLPWNVTSGTNQMSHSLATAVTQSEIVAVYCVLSDVHPKACHNRGHF